MATPKTPAEKLIKYVADQGLTYGDVLLHDDIEHAAGLSVPKLSVVREMKDQHELHKCMQEYQFALLAAVESLKKHMLIEHKMLLVNVRGQGYRIVQPNEQTDAAVRAGMKQVRKGLRTTAEGLEHTNVALLSAEEKSYNSSAKARLKGLDLMLGRGRDLLKIGS